MKWLLLCSFVVGTLGFKELQDGAKIEKDLQVGSSYSIPLRGSRKAERVAGVLSKFDDAEFNLISRMKTMETPPAIDAQDFYAQTKQIGSRFNSRVTRSLKFDESTNNKNSPMASSPPQSQGRSSVSFDGQKPSEDKDNKRFLPELFGFHGTNPGYYGGSPHHYPPPHHYPAHHYPTGQFYPNYGGYGNGYPGNGYYNPGSSSSAAAAASSSSGGYRPGGLYGNNYYGGGYGYYPGYNNGYYPPGGVAPILNGGYGGYPAAGGFIGGFFKNEDGRANTKGSSDKSKVNFDEK